MRHIFARVLPLPLWASLEPHRTQQTCTQLQTLELAIAGSKTIQD